MNSNPKGCADLKPVGAANATPLSDDKAKSEQVLREALHNAKTAVDRAYVRLAENILKRDTREVAR